MRATRRRLVVATVAWILGGLVLIAPRAAAASDIGVVVLHGKQGTGGDRTTLGFIKALLGAGYAVQAPTMCWAGTRIYDAPLPDCLKAVDVAIATLRAGGATRIVVAGQSLGGEGALIYGAAHPELTGVVALAPAGQPEGVGRNRKVAESVAEAKQMVAAGQGEQPASFADTNDGRNFTVTTTPVIYLSFMALGGPGDFPERLPQLRVPVIWVAGSQDRTQEAATTLFAQIPGNPLNKFVQVSATHLDTPNAGTDAVLDWLKTLPAR
jgi:pimeloyl-ACP methyl ester carboxylesterase